MVNAIFDPRDVLREHCRHALPTPPGVRFAGLGNVQAPIRGEFASVTRPLVFLMHLMALR